MHNTVRTEAVRPISSAHSDACLVCIYPPGPTMGRRFTLEGKPLVMGRDPDCDLCVNDSAVSRRHMQIVPTKEGFAAEDLGSTNGTYVNDRPVSRALLRDGDYLRTGSSIYRFLVGGNVEADYHQVIYEMIIRDALTDVHNKRFMLEFLDRELIRSTRHHRPLSVVMLDIDHFKAINDERGHLCGDATLRELAGRIKATIRRDELFSRYGGEEFTVVLPETDTPGAVQFAERLRGLIADTLFEYDGENFPVTISLGVATTAGNSAMTSGTLLQQADERLYEAKRLGRNRVVG